MLAVTWTALGILSASMFGVLFYLGGRIDAQGTASESRDAALLLRIDTTRTDLESRIDAQGAASETRDLALGARIDSLSARIDSLALRFDRHLEPNAG